MIVGAYHYPKAEVVRFDKPWTEAVPEEVARLGKKRVFVLASNTLLASPGFRAAAEQSLGPSLVGIMGAIRPHAPVPDVIDAARQASEASADVIAAVGGGSVIDAGKIVQLALAQNTLSPDALIASRTQRNGRPVSLPVRMIAVPTTLSGAEFTAFAGASDLQRNVKEAYAHPEMIPASVVLDPALSLGTPQELWLSTGIRAIDHAVEDLCSVNRHALSDAVAVGALRLLAPSLRRTKRDPGDLDARRDSLVGVWLSLIGTQGGVEKGGSHAIGHILGGSAGVPHGVTSCVMLPHVLRWNADADTGRQRAVSEALGAPDRAAADLVAELIADLDLPRRLRDVGVGRDDLDRLAALTMDDPWTATNPKPIRGPADIRAILEAAW